MATIADRRLNPNVRVCFTADGGGVLMNIERDRVYSLDRVGAVIWRLQAAGETPDAIARSISTAEGAPLAVAQDDVRRFLDRLEQMELLVRGRRPPPVVAAARTRPMETVFSEPITRTVSPPGNRGLVARSLGWLLCAELELRLRGFHALYRMVAEHPRRAVPTADGIVAAVGRAMDRACTLYLRQVRCLQRSAATVCLLRNYGVAASLVVGACKHPARAHAWVEVDGRVVNDKQGVKSCYQELDRF